LVSKVCNIQMVQLATQVITGELTGTPSPVPALKESKFHHYGVKEAVFPFNMFQEVDPLLGPEMRSTGEVLGLAANFGEAFYKAQEATQTRLPLEGTVLISVNDRDKEELLPVARAFHAEGFRIMATGRTCDMIVADGIPAEKIKKLQEGRPNVRDAIANGKVQLIINTPRGKESTSDDSYIRKMAIKGKIPYMTTMAAAIATAEGIRKAKEKNGKLEVKSLQQLHSEIE